MKRGAVMLPAMEQAGSPRSTQRFARALLLLFIIACIALLLVPWVQNVTGYGRVVALTPVERTQTIGAPVEGRIVRWHVIEGTHVKTGDLVAEIADNDPEILTRLEGEKRAVELRLDQARTRAQALQSRIEQLDMFRRNELLVAQNRLQGAEENVKAAEQVVKASDATLLAAKLNIDRQKALVQKGLVAIRAVELAQQDYDRASADLQRAKASLGAAEKEKLARESDLLRIESDFRTRIDDARASLASANADIANTEAELQRISVRVNRQTQQQVYAPREGRILRLLAQPGSEMMKPGDPIALFVPDSVELVVELFMDGNDIPLMHPGDKVRLQFEGWPAIQFAGWPSVAVGTFGGEIFLVDATDNGEGMFRILVKPDPNDEPWPDLNYLRQGVRANGWVLLRTVPLGFELWRQFNGFPPTVTPKDPGGPRIPEVKSKL
jgi:adhesin transport system membrane fusion protein